MEIRINDNFARTIIKETTRTLWFRNCIKELIKKQVETSVRKTLKKVYDTGFKDGFNANG